MGLGFKGVPKIRILVFGGLYWGCTDDILFMSTLRGGGGWRA